MEGIEEMVKETEKGAGEDCAVTANSVNMRDEAGKGESSAGERSMPLQHNKPAVGQGERAVSKASNPSLLGGVEGGSEGGG